jgi:hypothetical protein
MRRMPVYLILAALLLAILAAPVAARATPQPFGMVYAGGETYRTFGVPANVPAGTGNDNIAAFTNGVAGQAAVSEVAPGTPGYDGGRWAVWEATWTVTPPDDPVTDFATVLQLAADGDIILTRMPDADFRCPLLPGGG